MGKPLASRRSDVNSLSRAPSPPPRRRRRSSTVASPPEDLIKRGLRGLQRRLLDRFGAPPTTVGPVHVIFEGRAEGDVPPNISILAAAERLGVDLNHYCGGTCSCGTCRVEIAEGGRNLSRPEGREQMVLGAVFKDRGDRLGCQARVLGPVRVKVPNW